MPVGLRRRHARRSPRARSADNKDRWLVDARSRDRQDARSSTRCTTTRGCAKPAARRIAACEFLPDNQRASGSCPSATAGCTSTRSTSRADGAKAEQLTIGQVGNRPRAELSPRRQEVLPHHAPKCIRASATLHHAGRRRRAHAAHDDDRLERGGRCRRTRRRSALVYSYSTKPPEVYVMPNRAGRRGAAGHDHADRGVARRSSGSTRRSSPTRRATASTSTRGSSRRR